MPDYAQRLFAGQTLRVMQEKQFRKLPLEFEKLVLKLKDQHNAVSGIFGSKRSRYLSLRMPLQRKSFRTLMLWRRFKGRR